MAAKQSKVAIFLLLCPQGGVISAMATWALQVEETICALRSGVCSSIGDMHTAAGGSGPTFKGDVCLFWAPLTVVVGTWDPLTCHPSIYVFANFLIILFYFMALWSEKMLVMNLILVTIYTFILNQEIVYHIKCS